MQLGVAAPSPHLPHAWTRGSPLGLRPWAGWSLACGESPSLCPPPPEFYKELAWVPESQRKHTGRDASLHPYFCSSLGLRVPSCPRQPLPAVFQPRRRLTALSSPTATATSAWGAPRRQGVLRTSSPVRTVGDQVMPPPHLRLLGAGVERLQIWRVGSRGERTGANAEHPGG